MEYTGAGDLRVYARLSNIIGITTHYVLLRFPVPCNCALKSYMTSWFSQNLSRVFERISSVSSYHRVGQIGPCIHNPVSEKNTSVNHILSDFCKS